jgi:hypothetical protein
MTVVSSKQSTLAAKMTVRLLLQPSPLIDGHDLELGQRDRRIARFDGKPS